MEAIHVNPYDCIQWLVVATVNGPMSFILPLIPPSDYEPGLRVDS